MTYIVNHTALGVTHAAGDLYEPEDGVDIDRLLALGAIRQATEDEIAAVREKGIPVPGAVFLGEAPEGQTRVSNDTFAALPAYDVNPAGKDQSAAAKAAKGKDEAKPDAPPNDTNLTNNGQV